MPMGLGHRTGAEVRKRPLATLRWFWRSCPDYVDPVGVAGKLYRWIPLAMPDRAEETPVPSKLAAGRGNLAPLFRCWTVPDYRTPLSGPDCPAEGLRVDVPERLSLMPREDTTTMQQP